MATFNITQLSSLLAKLPLYKSEQVTNDLERGLNNRAYKTLWHTFGGQYGDILNDIFNTNPVVLNNTTDQSNMVQTAMSGKDTGAFKWVQENLTPEMFVSSDSCFIAFGKPTYVSNSTGTDFSLIGLCQDVSFNVGVNVVTLKEMRADRNIIIPLKATPGNVTIRRLLSTTGNLNSLTHSGSSWVFDAQNSLTKELFGILISFMTPGRTKDIASIYLERCAINSIGVSINAGNFVMSETISAVFDRIKDGVQVTDKELTQEQAELASYLRGPSGATTSSNAYQGITLGDSNINYSDNVVY